MGYISSVDGVITARKVIGNIESGHKSSANFLAEAPEGAAYWIDDISVTDDLLQLNLCGSGKAYDLKDDLSELLDDLQDKNYEIVSFEVIRAGEEPGDVEKFVRRNGLVESMQATVTFPDGTAYEG